METCAAGGELDNYTGIRDTAWDLEKCGGHLKSELGLWSEWGLLHVLGLWQALVVLIMQVSRKGTLFWITETLLAFLLQIKKTVKTLHTKNSIYLYMKIFFFTQLRIEMKRPRADAQE